MVAHIKNRIPFEYLSVQPNINTWFFRTNHFQKSKLYQTLKIVIFNLLVKKTKVEKKSPDAKITCSWPWSRCRLPRDASITRCELENAHLLWISDERITLRYEKHWKKIENFHLTNFKMNWFDLILVMSCWGVSVRYQFDSNCLSQLRPVEKSEMNLIGHLANKLNIFSAGCQT